MQKTFMIAIDGACRRNGKPDCVSAGGVFIYEVCNTTDKQLIETLNIYEGGSTNQRGELLALLRALRHLIVHQANAMIITDSEYIFNAMTKEWYKTWENNNWLTSSGTDVKNADLWNAICGHMESCSNLDITFYHIKGHCIPFGKVTATNLLEQDKSGKTLYEAVVDKYRSTKDKYDKKLEEANELSSKNNGFNLSDDLLEKFVVMNTVADAVATQWVEIADRTLV